MSYPVKFLSLQKTELEYEVLIRGATPAATVQELRKQISKLGPLFPSEDILESSLPVADDLTGVSDVLTKVKNLLDSSDKNTLLRAENFLHHLYHRLNRITREDKSQQVYDACVLEFRTLLDKFNSVKDNGFDALIPSTSKSEPQLITPPPINVNVSCDRNLTSELFKIKYDGKTCVRSFIQRISEVSKARDIPNSKLMSIATEIFTGDALHWFRSVRDKVSDWDQLITLLIVDFDQADYDYRLLSEIRARTQGESENITVYLSVMHGLFSRLARDLTNEEKLEIILHNIRPCYASTLAAYPDIPDIGTLKSVCRNYENVQTRLAGFKEPPKKTVDTLAPEFAYTGPTSYSQRFTNFKPKYNTYNSNNNNNNNNMYNKTKTYTNNNKFNENKFEKSNNSGNNKYVHAMQSETPKTLYCPRCRNNTHNLRQCKGDKNIIFCFICGHEGVKSPDCPNCNKHKLDSSKN